MYRQGRNYENLNKGIFDGTGTYGIPHLFTEQVTADSFIGFNYAKSCKVPYDKGLHFFIDDYQFERVWNTPEKYISILQKAMVVHLPLWETQTVRKVLS